MVVGYIKQNAILADKLLDIYKNGVPAFKGNPATDIIIPLRVDSIDQVFGTDETLLIYYTNGVTVRIQVHIIGNNQSPTPAPPGLSTNAQTVGTPASVNGYRELFLTWASNILKGVPQPRFDEICGSYWYDQSGPSTTTGSEFLQLTTIIEGAANTTSNPESSYNKMLRYFRKDVGQYYSQMTLSDSVFHGETSQWGAFGGAGTGKFKWIQNGGLEEEITYTIPSELQADLAHDYVPGDWSVASTNVQALSTTVQINGPGAPAALNAMTAVNFQNTGTVGQGPGIEFEFTYANGNTASIFLEYIAYQQGVNGFGQLDPNLNQLTLRKPSNKATPANWEVFAYAGAGFGEVITNLKGPYLESPIIADDLYAAELMRTITQSRNGINPVEVFTSPDGFDISGL